MLEVFGQQYINPALKDVYVFAALIIVLLVKPGGILGKATVEKV